MVQPITVAPSIRVLAVCNGKCRSRVPLLMRVPWLNATRRDIAGSVGHIELGCAGAIS